jgi:hypothetical protein
VTFIMDSKGLMMPLGVRFLLWLALLPVLAIRADVMIAYEFAERGAEIPGARRSHAFDRGRRMVLQVRGNRGSIAMGGFRVVVDLGKQDTIVINSTTKTFTRIPLMELMDDGPNIPLQFRRTGRVDRIEGVQAEQWDSTGTDDVFERHVTELWLPKSEGAQGSPALAEFARFRAGYVLTSDFAPFYTTPPEGATGITGMIRELLQRPLRLRMRVASYLVKPVTNGILAGLDPNTPLSELKQDIIGLSTATIENSFFLPPAGYREAPFTEVLKLPPLDQSRP